MVAEDPAFWRAGAKDILVEVKKQGRRNSSSLRSLFSI